MTTQNLSLSLPADPLVGMGEAALLSQYDKNLAKIPVAKFTHNIASAQENDHFLLLKDDDTNTTIGFVTYGLLSGPTSKLYIANFRYLNATELVSGDELWMLLASAPFGHTKQLDDLLLQQFTSKERLYYADNNTTRSITNPHYVEPE